jgi:hypothetical protein
MKTEELLHYEAQYKSMQEAFGTHLLVFEFPKQIVSPHDRKEFQNLCKNRRGQIKVGSRGDLEGYRGRPYDLLR